jgi:hypothetical protein
MPRGRPPGAKKKNVLTEPKEASIDNFQPESQPEDDIHKIRILRKCKDKAYDDYWIQYSDKSREAIDGILNLFLKNIETHFSLKKRK